MNPIYDEISGPSKILRMKTAPEQIRDWAGMPRRLGKLGVRWLLVLMAAYGFSKLSHEYILQSVRVDGPSMAPTLPDAKYLLLNHLTYRFREPKPNDIAVFQDPVDKALVVKRIVAQPGDRVYVKGGRLFVNGKSLPEPYLEPGTKTYAGPDYRAQMWICGLNQYFVLGDNRDNSTDSRVYGTVPRKNFLGTIMPMLP